MSEVKVNKISPRSGTAITLGDSGDTFTIPSGATLAIAGSVTGFTSAGIDDNATSVAITIDSSERVGIGISAPASKLQVTSASSGGTPHASVDELAVENSANSGINILSGASNEGAIYFGDSSDNDVGRVRYNHADNSMHFFTNASEAIRITSAGLVGIGTSSPGYKLTVQASADNQDLIRLNHPSAATAGAMLGFTTDGTTDNNVVVLGVQYSNVDYDVINIQRSTQNVGIGETAPLGKLHVKSGDSGASVNSGHNQVIAENSGNSGMTILSGTSSNGAICFGDDGNNCIGYLNYNHANNYYAIGVNNAERMRILSSGNIGIGTSSADYLLTVGSNASGGQGNALSQRQAHFSTDFSSEYNPANSATWAGISVHNGDNSSTRTSTGLTFISRSSNSGVAAILSTNDGSSQRADLRFITRGAGDVIGERMRITDDGNIVAPNLNTTGSTSNRYPLYWVHTGTTGSIEPYTGSIRAMKTDINDMDSVNWIHSLTPRSFKFRDYETDKDGNKVYLETTNNLPNTEYGLIAEEVNEVNGSDYILDKQTDEDGNEKLKGVLYHNLVPVLLKAVQEQKNTIQELEARITTLEANNP